MIRQLGRTFGDRPNIIKIRCYVNIGQVPPSSHSSWENLVGLARVPRYGNLTGGSCGNPDAKRPLIVAYQRRGYRTIVDISFDLAQVTLAAPDLGSELAEGDASFFTCPS